MNVKSGKLIGLAPYASAMISSSGLNAGGDLHCPGFTGEQPNPQVRPEPGTAMIVVLQYEACSMAYRKSDKPPQ